MIKDIRKRRNTHTSGYQKVEGFARYVRENITDVHWVWVDTCCINQESSQEVSEAVNSMFRWYFNAEVCLAYLADVMVADDINGFRESSWFTRGWTLQELLAPDAVVFLTCNWQIIGHKGSNGYGKSGTELRVGPLLQSTVAAITGIPESVLSDYGQSRGFSIETRLKWTIGRQTTREEDLSYCLLGILDVTMPIIYGEGGEKARKRLLEHLHQDSKIHEERLVSTETSVETPPKPFSNVPFRRDPDFVNRGTLIECVREKLAAPAGRAALVGLGGAGKSQLAIEFVYQLRERSPETWVLWIHANNVARFEQGMRNIADIVKIRGREDPKASIFKLVQDWLLDRRNGEWVVILDNADDAAFLVEIRTVSQRSEGSDNASYTFFEFLPVCNHGSILVTTRSENAALRLVDHHDMITVDPMDNEDAIALLQKKFGQQEDRTDMSELVAALECMPLAITQAATYIRQRGRRCSVQQYLGKLRKSDGSKKSILDEDAGDLRRDRGAKNSIILTWQISFEHIYHARRSAADLLSLMSFCDRQAIPELLLRTKDVEREEKQTDTDSSKDGDKDCSECSDANDNFKLRRSSSDSSMDDGFENDIVILQDYSFISVSTNPSTFEMHRLVQLAMHRWLESQGQLDKWKEQFIGKLCTAFPPGRHENWKTCQLLFPHAWCAFGLKPKNRLAILKWASTMQKAAQYASSKGGALLWMQAEELKAQVMATRRRMLGEEHPDTLTSIANLASTYRNQGRWKEAEELDVQVLEISKRELGEEHPSTLTRMANLASTYWNQGRWKEAEELEVQELEISKRELGEELPDTLTNTANLASTYRNQGRWKEAEELEVQVLEISKRELGEELPDTLTSTANLASTYRNQGRWKEAEELEVEVLEISKRELGEEHPDTLTSTANLACTYWNQGRWKEAEKLEVQVLEILKRELGEEHPDTLTRMANLAHIISTQGHDQSALELMSDCAVRSSRILGVDHPYTVERWSSLEDWSK